MAKKKSTKPRKPRGPVLRWNDTRDRALVTIMSSNGGGIESITAEVRTDEAFDACQEAVTVFKVNRRINFLRKQGANIRKFDRLTYRPDITALNELCG